LPNLRNWAVLRFGRTRLRQHLSMAGAELEGRPQRPGRRTNKPQTAVGTRAACDRPAPPGTALGRVPAGAELGGRPQRPGRRTNKPQTPGRRPLARRKSRPRIRPRGPPPPEAGDRAAAPRTAEGGTTTGTAPPADPRGPSCHRPSRHPPAAPPPDRAAHQAAGDPAATRCPRPPPADPARAGAPLARPEPTGPETKAFLAAVYSLRQLSGTRADSDRPAPPGTAPGAPAQGAGRRRATGSPATAHRQGGKDTGTEG
jgi:hypothetical protein